MNYKRITVDTLAKIAIGLLVIIAISILAGTFQNNTFETISELNASISEKKEEMARLDEIIAEYEKKLPDLKKEEETARQDLNKAKAECNKVCSRSSYSWRYCDSKCRYLHYAVDSASDKLDDCKEAIADGEETKRSRAKLDEEIKGLKSRKAKESSTAFFLIVAMLLALAGLIFISMFMLDRTNTKKGLIACGMLAGSSLIYMALPTATTFLTYLFGIAVFAIFAGLISDKIQKRIVARVFAIIFSIIIFAVTLITAPVAAVCSAIAFILMSLVLVPCVFTEYLDIAKHIFFTIITLGIWHLIWMYNHTENLNKVEQAEKRAPIRELLLCAFLPLYYIFWTYKTAGNTELYANEKGKNFKIDILCFILSVVNPLLASVIIQDKINMIVGKPVVENVIEEVSEEAPVEEILEEASIAE